MRIRSLVLATAVVVAACGGPPEPAGGRAADLAAVELLPPEVKRAPATVREAYQFAVANAELLRQFPCHCGCGSMGHTSNAACYLKPESRPGQWVFDGHALGCTICVDITQDVMRMRREGLPVAEMQRYIRDTYARYGPSNLP